MYVTRPLSLYKTSPGAASAPPPEGPHSGYLATLDEEFDAQATCCWGLCKNRYLGDLPFPQNRLLNVEYTTSNGQSSYTSRKVCTCSREEDKRTCCFCSCVNDVNPRPFDHGDIYQQVEVVPSRGCGGGFYARAVAPDGFPSYFLRRKGWRIWTSHPRSLSLDLGAAAGVDHALRARMPDTNFPISSLRSPAVVVGKWYCPFIFVKEEGCPPKEPMKRSVFYEVTLEQFWEAIHTCENTTRELEGSVHLSTIVRRESALLRGSEPVGKELSVVEGVVWFRPAKAVGAGVGLCAAVVERMRWEQERAGWAAGKGAVEMVERVEEYRGGGWGWGRFGCYALVERFALRRMDGCLVLAYDFRHVHKIITKWE